jgi:hypothetical protein
MNIPTLTASQKPCGGPAAEQRTTGRPSRAGSVDPERFDNCALPREMRCSGAVGDVCSGGTITAPVAAESRDAEATRRCEWRFDQTLKTSYAACRAPPRRRVGVQFRVGQGHLRRQLGGPSAELTSGRS